MTGAVYQTALAMVAVLAIIFLFATVLRKRQSGGGIMEVMAYKPIGPRKGVSVLRVGGEILILGVTQNEIRLLKALKAGEFHPVAEGEAFSSMLGMEVDGSNG
jgi:flagellar biogenesis protein FliO